MFGFGPRKPAAATGSAGAAGVSVTSTAAHASALTPGSDRPRPVRLGTTADALPLVARLDARPLEIGAVDQVRRAPHLVCTNYLAQLGTPRQWKAGRGAVTPESATAATFAAVLARLPGTDAVGLALPGYLTAAQVKTALLLAADARLPVRGSCSTALAVAAHRAAAVLSDEPGPGLDADGARPDWVVPLRPSSGSSNAVVIVDCDDHALTATVVRLEPERAHVVAAQTWQAFALKVWKDRLADGLADRCVRVCRRDPRDSAAADQLLYDQLDPALDRARAGLPATVAVRGEHWFQELTPAPNDLAGYCHALAHPAGAAVGELLRAADLTAPPRAVWLLHAAARLPGLDALVRRHTPEATGIHALPEHAAADAVAALADTLPKGHAADALPVATPPGRATTARAAGGFERPG